MALSGGHLMLACTFDHDVFVRVVYFCWVAVVIYAYVKTEKDRS